MKKTWEKFEDLIVQHFKEFDPFIRRTKASGASNEKGDIKTNLNLHIECKDYNKKSVYNENWMQKCIEEVPLHSKKLPILITRNKEDKIRVHMDFQDFLILFKESIKND